MKRGSKLSGVLHMLVHMAEYDTPVTSVVLARAMNTNPGRDPHDHERLGNYWESEALLVEWARLKWREVDRKGFPDHHQSLNEKACGRE